MKEYDSTFFRYVNSGAVTSARRLLPVVRQLFPVQTVLDIGCGQGAWLAVWRELGVDDVTGVDGSYVDTDKLLIPRERFIARDLAAGFDLGRQFTLVQCLEVAEHLPEDSADRFVASLVRHGNLVLFSAACKGQGGENHLNEQDYDYWRALFAHHGYIAVDFLRRRILTDNAIEPWYRYNTILYASSDAFAGLPAAVRDARVPEHQRIADLSPWFYRLRKRIVMLLPVPVATRVARVKERAVVLTRAPHGDRNP